MTPELPVNVHRMEELLFMVLAQLVVIVVAARLGGRLAVRCGQTRVVGEIIVGLLLGPSLFGAVLPTASAALFSPEVAPPITVLSQIGLILLMFQIGLEFDFSHLLARHNRHAVAKVSAVGLALPFVLGIGFAGVSHVVLAPTIDAQAYALFIGTAFAITALPILGRIMLEFQMTRSVIGVIAISSAAINDVVGWLLLAGVTMIAVADFDAGSFALRLLGLAGYVVLSWCVLRPLLQSMLKRNAVSEQSLPLDVVGFVIAAMFLSAMATYKLGIFAIFGGFMLGVLLHDHAGFVAAWRRQIGGFVMVFFLPIFFTYTGLRTDIGALQGSLWAWCGLLITLATFGKFYGCYVAARWAGLDPAQARVIGAMMNTRALMELVVINIGFDLGVIPASVFSMLVLMAIFSTVITTPLLKRWLPAAGLSAVHHPQ